MELINNIALSIIAAIALLVIGWNAHFIYTEIKRKRDRYGK